MSDDIEDKIETERFREIMTVKKDVIETRDEFRRAYKSGQIAKGTYLELYQEKVRDYLISIETVLNPAEGSVSDYWTKRHIGQFELPNGEKKSVDGLQEFIHLPSTFVVESEQTVQRSYRHKPEQKPVSQTVRPPKRLIEQAFRVANQAMDDAGFDIRTGDDDRSTFHNIEDIEGATQLEAILNSLDEDALQQLITVIQDRHLTNGHRTNGHHE